MSHIIDGKKIAADILAELKKQIAGRSLGLAAVVVGDDPSLKSFVEVKKKAAQAIGVQFSSYIVDSPASLDGTMRWLANDDQVQGIIVELPIPKEFDTQKTLDMIPREKDIDVLTTDREKDFYAGDFTLLPPAVGALKILFDTQHIAVVGKTVAVFGQGRLVGKPIAHWLEAQGAHVFRIDEFTPEAKSHSLQADVIISGVGKPGLITEDMIKDDAVVIDYGFSARGAGDVDFKKVAKKASLITPVPGGMGPLVVVVVLQNLVELSM